ncbi:MAG TPA: hypothetical protein QGI59_03470 [Candidatus Poseidoniia archaeon]|jgi:hypothetical protein|nr:hypothetical protein [Candidatus Poseidoniia archaeon]|tara:strand:+ start:4984 stop:5661 length:678 start_codon:yes stop_codon:yes gene_type:complete
MEEPELRVGGWEKEGGRRFFRRFFSLILILVLIFLAIGPSFVYYNPAYVPKESLYLANGMWNGPFDSEYSKEFSGHLKLSSISYETIDGESGKLKIISVSSLMNLGQADLEKRVIEIVKEEAQTEALTLSNGVILKDDTIDLPAGYSIYQWDGNSKEINYFSGENIIVKAFFWNEKDELNSIKYNEFNQIGAWLGMDQYQTVLCIAFGTDGTTINQAAKMVEDVF